MSETYAPVTSSIGFLELSLEEAVDALERWRRSLYPAVTVSAVDQGFPASIKRLEPLTGGSRPRELLVAGEGWTAYFDNSLRGTDAVSTIGYLSRKQMCQGLAVQVVPHTVGAPGIRMGRMGAVQFELFGPLGTDFLNYVRTVSVLHDGQRWHFTATGTEQEFERPEIYHARRVRERFTSEMLEEYCHALGVKVFDPTFYGPNSMLIESDVPPAPDGYEMTLRQVQDWLEIVPMMADGLPG